MTTFIKLTSVPEKSSALLDVVLTARQGNKDYRRFSIDAKVFSSIPGSPFSYWVSDSVRESFLKFHRFEGDGRTAKVGLATADDFRFLRVWWETDPNSIDAWFPLAKGGGFSQFYADIPILLKWQNHGSELKETVIAQHGNAGKRVYNEDYYFRPGITWPLRAHRFSPQLLPEKCIFSVRGYSIFSSKSDLLSMVAMLNSSAFDYLFKTSLGRFGCTYSAPRH